MMGQSKWISILSAALCMAIAGTTAAQTSPGMPGSRQTASLGIGFAYQGQLRRSGSAYTGSCDFQFSLWDASASGAQLGSTQFITSVTVTRGQFGVQLNEAGQFGPNAFTGEAGWLEVAVQCADDAGFTTLSPRTALGAVPYALSLRPGAVVANSVSGASAIVAGTYNGLYAQSPADAGILAYGGAGYAGVRGENINFNSVGVLGVASQSGSTGVIGNGAAIGVKGVSNQPGSVGVWGESSTNTGVYGVSTNGRGVWGASDNAVGVYGQGGATSSGVHGKNDYANSIGVKGEASSSGSVGVWGESTANTGVYGLTSSGRAIFGQVSNGGTGQAGYFQGPVQVTGNLTKGGGSFKIDHPLDPANQYLYHSFVESPDMMNIYNGNITTDANGFAVVELADWFEALNKDFRYQLTVVGQFAQAIVAKEIEKNAFTIQTDKPRVKVSWQVTGIRKDPYANAHRIPVEEIKPAGEQGKYLHPDAYGLPASMGVNSGSGPADRKP